MPASKKIPVATTISVFYFEIFIGERCVFILYPHPIFTSIADLLPKYGTEE